MGVFKGVVVLQKFGTLRLAEEFVETEGKKKLILRDHHQQYG